MDFATIGGLVLGISAIVVSYILEGGHLSSVVQLPALMIVIGGTIGASTVTTSFSTVLAIPTYLRIALFSRHHDSEHTIGRIIKMAERARREGILGLESELSKIDQPFFQKAMQLVIDGTEITALKSILETEISFMEDRHRKGIELFRKMGGFAPTMGIIGTVLGLIHTLANTGEPARMASAIASAFIATLWGVATANLIYLPISDKLKMRHDEEMSNLELVMEGAVSIQSGDNPRIIRNKMMSFLKPEARQKE
jgi:chemotaxis protein MotA